MLWKPQQLLDAAVRVETGGEFTLPLLAYLPWASGEPPLFTYKTALETTNLLSTLQTLLKSHKQRLWEVKRNKNPLA